MIDEEAYKMENTKPQRLSCVPVEHLAISEEKKKILMLIQVDNDMKLLKGKATKANAIQSFPCT